MHHKYKTTYFLFMTISSAVALSIIIVCHIQMFSQKKTHKTLLKDLHHINKENQMCEFS